MMPDDFTLKEHMIEVGDGHQLYVQDWGNPNATLPIVSLHGGPGSGAKNRHRQRFNPYVHRVIFFDQRGSGKSLPYGSLEHNTTQDLVDDIEKIAQSLQINKFYITGGSWGSTLALAYALKYPNRIEGMIIQGIFTGSQAEIDYLDNGGYTTYFPDVWENYLDHTPASYKTNPTKYHYGRILGVNKQHAKESAYVINNVEASLMSLDDRFTPEEFESFDPAPTTIEAYYLANRCFMPDRYILDNAHKLNMHIWIVQGRYDFVCPPATAYELYKKLPNGTLIWTMAGHGNDRSNYDVLSTLFAQWS